MSNGFFGYHHYVEQKNKLHAETPLLIQMDWMKPERMMQGSIGIHIFDTDD